MTEPAPDPEKPLPDARRPEAPLSVATTSRSVPTGAFVMVGLAFFTVATLYLAANVLIPAVGALVVWVVLNALADGVRRLPMLGPRLSRPQALLVATCAVFAIGLFVVESSVATLTELGPRVAGFRDALDPIANRLAPLIGVEAAELIDLVIDSLRIEAALWAVVAGLAALISQSGIVAIYVAFLLVDQQFFGMKLERLVPDPGRRARVRAMLGHILEANQAYLRIMTIMSIVTAVLSYVVMRLMGLDYAIFWATMIFFLNYIPTIGSILGTVLPAAFALLQFQELWPTFLVLTGVGLVQFVVGNVLLPRFAGSTLNISLFVTLFSLFSFGALWGITGMFVAMPMTAMLIITFSYFDSTRPIAILLSRTGDLEGPPR